MEKTELKKFNVKTIKSGLLSYANLFALFFVVLVFWLINPSFLNAYNMKNLMTNMAPLLVMACGATYVRLLGSLDLSMGAVCSCANVMLVKLFPKCGFTAYLIAVLFGMLTGFILGFIHTKLKIPSFIASLGMMNVYNSLALLISEYPELIQKSEKVYINWAKKTYGFFGMTAIVAIILMFIMHFIQKSTTFGKSLNMIGANERTARISGVNVVKNKIIAFTVCGMTSALSGCVLAIKLQSSAPTVGSSFTLLAVAAVLIGGTSMTGGKGSVLKSFVGVMMVTVIQNGMIIIGVDAFWSMIVFGALILVAMILTADRSGKNTIVK